MEWIGVSMRGEFHSSRCVGIASSVGLLHQGIGRMILHEMMATSGRGTAQTASLLENKPSAGAARIGARTTLTVSNKLPRCHAGHIDIAINILDNAPTAYRGNVGFGRLAGRIPHCGGKTGLIVDHGVVMVDIATVEMTLVVMHMAVRVEVELVTVGLIVARVMGVGRLRIAVGVRGLAGRVVVLQVSVVAVDVDGRL